MSRTRIYAGAIAVLVLTVSSCDVFLPADYVESLRTRMDITVGLTSKANLGTKIHPDTSMGLGGAYGDGVLWYVTNTRVFSLSLPNFGVLSSYTFQTPIPASSIFIAYNGITSAPDRQPWYYVKDSQSGDATLWTQFAAGYSGSVYWLVTIPINDGKAGEPTVSQVTDTGALGTPLPLGLSQDNRKITVRSQVNGGVLSLGVFHDGVQDSFNVPDTLSAGYFLDFSPLSGNAYYSGYHLLDGSTALTIESKGIFDFSYYELALSQFGATSEAIPKRARIDFSNLIATQGATGEYTDPYGFSLLQTNKFDIFAESNGQRLVVQRRSDNRQIMSMRFPFSTAIVATDDGIIFIGDTFWNSMQYIPNHTKSDFDTEFSFYTWWAQ